MKRVLFIFGQLNDNDVDWLSACGRREILSIGQELITPGQEIHDLFFVLYGELVVYRKDGEKVTSLTCGEIVGEMSFVDTLLPETSVCAVSEAGVLAIRKDCILQKMKSDNGFGMRFYKAISIFLADRIRELHMQISGNCNATDEQNKGELYYQVVDNIAAAGARFSRMIKSL